MENPFMGVGNGSHNSFVPASSVAPPPSYAEFNSVVPPMNNGEDAVRLRNVDDSDTHVAKRNKAETPNDKERVVKTAAEKEAAKLAFKHVEADRKALIPDKDELPPLIPKGISNIDFQRVVQSLISRFARNNQNIYGLQLAIKEANKLLYEEYYKQEREKKERGEE